MLSTFRQALWRGRSHPLLYLPRRAFRSQPQQRMGYQRTALRVNGDVARGYIIGIAGCTNSGKTLLAEGLAAEVWVPNGGGVSWSAGIDGFRRALRCGEEGSACRSLARTNSTTQRSWCVRCRVPTTHPSSSTTTTILRRCAQCLTVLPRQQSPHRFSPHV